MPAEEHARSWIDAWNRHDLEAILVHYAGDVVFTAPTVVVRWGRADGLLRGKAELREHFERGLKLAPMLRFDVEGVFECPGGYALLYRRDNGNRVVEVVELDDAGKIVRARAHYEREQA